MKITLELPDDTEAFTITLVGGAFRNRVSIHAFKAKDGLNVIHTKDASGKIIMFAEGRKDNVE